MGHFGICNKEGLLAILGYVTRRKEAVVRQHSTSTVKSPATAQVYKFKGRLMGRFWDMHRRMRPALIKLEEKVS